MTISQHWVVRASTGIAILFKVRPDRFFHALWKIKNDVYIGRTYITSNWYDMGLLSFLYLRICVFYIWYTGMSYLISLNPMLFKNIAHVGSFKHFVFLYLRICVIVYLCILHLIHGNVIFDILESNAFQKYSTCWVLSLSLSLSNLKNLKNLKKWVLRISISPW